MGKRSSDKSKSRHAEKRQIRNVLLTYSFHDSLQAETIYTARNEVVVMEHLKADVGFTQRFAEFGEVLTSPLGESPTLQQLLDDSSGW